MYRKVQRIQRTGYRGSEDTGYRGQRIQGMQGVQGTAVQGVQVQRVQSCSPDVKVKAQVELLAHLLVAQRCPCSHNYLHA